MAATLASTIRAWEGSVIRPVSEALVDWARRTGASEARERRTTLNTQINAGLETTAPLRRWTTRHHPYRRLPTYTLSTPWHSVERSFNCPDYFIPNGSLLTLLHSRFRRARATCHPLEDLCATRQHDREWPASFQGTAGGKSRARFSVRPRCRAFPRENRTP